MEPWRLSRESLVPAETITGSRLETEGKKRKKKKKGQLCPIQLALHSAWGGGGWLRV